MKMHTLKKVLSVICVLAVMLSVCVVSFAGGSSAAGGGTEYTLNNAGKVSKVQLNAGDALPMHASFPRKSTLKSLRRQEGKFYLDDCKPKSHCHECKRQCLPRLL